jgi:acetylornithine deacetylase
VTPSLAELQIFLRTMPGVDHSPLVRQLESIVVEHGLEIVDKGGTLPWGVEPGSDWIVDMSRILGAQGSETVCFATDAGVLQRLRKLMICGPGSIAQAHRSDEWIAIDQLQRGVTIYEQAFRRWAC